MKTKKFLLAVLAVVMICALSVAGTMAFLAQRANEGNAVTNTFMAYDPIDPDVPFATSFDLKEHDYTQATDGSFTKGDLGTTGNNYKIMPGMVLPKDPHIVITEKNDIPAYLYLEVVGGLTDGIYEAWGVEDYWESLGAIGNHSGTLYVYAADGENATPITKTTTVPDKDLNGYNIIAGKQIKVKNEPTAEIDADYEDELTFYAYLAQATVSTKDSENKVVNSSDPATVYNVCFPPTSSDT